MNNGMNTLIGNIIFHLFRNCGYGWFKYSLIICLISQSFMVKVNESAGSFCNEHNVRNFS